MIRIHCLVKNLGWLNIHNIFFCTHSFHKIHILQWAAEIHSFYKIDIQLAGGIAGKSYF